MPFLRDMPGRVWDYISPRKTQKRREKPFKVPAVPLKSRAVAKQIPEMTPESKIENWEAKALATPGSIDNTLLPPSPPMSLSRYHDFDGDTLIDSVEQDEGSDEWDANDGTLLVDDGEYLEMHKPANLSKEQHRQEIQCRELRSAGWSEDAVFMFQKLNMRGFEPLLPKDWVNDFDTLPLDLFTYNESKAFIKAGRGSDYRAQHALHRLFALGGLARDAVLTRAPRRTSERQIIKAVRDYSQWAMQDGGLHHVYADLSLFETVFCSKETPSYTCEQKMIRKLWKLHAQWEQVGFQLHDKTGLVTAPEELPTLYGIIASHTVMAFVSYVLPTEVNPYGSLRTIAIFDFGEEGYDVWNSFAVAIFVIHCRNRMQLLSEFLPEPVVTHGRDPDL